MQLIEDRSVVGDKLPTHEHRLLLFWIDKTERPTAVRLLGQLVVLMGKQRARTGGFIKSW
jgi:hypothetical protein